MGGQNEEHGFSLLEISSKSGYNSGGFLTSHESQFPHPAMGVVNVHHRGWLGGLAEIQKALNNVSGLATLNPC